MHRLQIFLDLFFIVLTFNYASGVKNKVFRHEKGRNSDLNTYNGDPPFYFLNGEKFYSGSNAVASSSQHGLHPEQTDLSKHEFVSWNEHETTGDLRSMLEHYMDFPMEYPIPVHEKVSTLFDEMIRDALGPANPHQKSDGSNIQRDESSRSIGSSNGYDLQVQAENLLDQSQVELIVGSGVKINREKLKKILKQYRKDPIQLTRSLLEVLIPIDELLTMKVTNRDGHKSIPDDIRYTLEEFVDREAKNKLSHGRFQYFLTSHLDKLRSMEYVVYRNQNRRRLSSFSNSMVELSPGSGIKLRESFLFHLIYKYHKHPKVLIRYLFEALIPSKELASMYVKNYIGYKTVPDNILFAVKDFIRQVAEPELSHNSFMRTLSSFLSKLRTKYQTNKRL